MFRKIAKRAMAFILSLCLTLPVPAVMTRAAEHSDNLRNPVATATGKVVLVPGPEFNETIHQKAGSTAVSNIRVTYASSAPTGGTKVSVIGEAYLTFASGTATITCIGKSGDLYANNDSSWMYSDLDKLSNTDFLSQINYADAETMAGMFFGDKAITSLDLTKVNMQNVSIITNMLDGMDRLTKIKTPTIFTVSPAYSMMRHEAVATLPGTYSLEGTKALYTELKYTIPGERWLTRTKIDGQVPTGDISELGDATITGTPARGGDTIFLSTGKDASGNTPTQDRLPGLGATASIASTKLTDTIAAQKGTFGRGGNSIENNTHKLLAIPGGGGFQGGGAGFAGVVYDTKFSNKTLPALQVYAGAGGSGYLNQTTIFSGTRYDVQDTEQKKGVKTGDGEIRITFIGLGSEK